MKTVIDSCKVGALEALELFVEAVELSSNLEIEGTAFPKSAKGGEVFVIRDHSIKEGIEGAHVEMSVAEIIEKVTCVEDASQAVKTISNERASIVLNGITRIVGYYSRVNNWNKSKIGELRDRAKGQYGVSSNHQNFQDDRLSMIDSL